MYNISFAFILPLFFSCTGLFAGPAGATTDTLILNSGETVTGTISKKSLESYTYMQADLNAGVTEIDAGNGDTRKISNKEINYFIINRVRYANRKMTGGHKFVKVLAEGKASVYNWSGESLVPHTRETKTGGGTNDGGYYVNRTTTMDKMDIDAILLVKDGKVYNTKPKNIKNFFPALFGDCSGLMEKSKQPGFDFGDAVSIANEYNACGAHSGH